MRIAAQPCWRQAQFSLSVASGALVIEVVPSSAAERAGLKQGDVIVAFDKRTGRGGAHSVG